MAGFFGRYLTRQVALKSTRWGTAAAASWEDGWTGTCPKPTELLRRPSATHRRMKAAKLSAAARHRGTEGSNPFPSSGESHKLEQQHDLRGRTAPGGGHPWRRPANEGPGPLGKTPNPRTDSTPRASTRCPLAVGPRPPLSDNQTAEDWCSTVWLLVRGRVPTRVWVPARSWKASGLSRLSPKGQ
jgi:hypothetical protein